jgi:hypothetical protein
LDVSIQEKSFSFGVGYSIETPETTLQAHKKIFSLLPHITLQSAYASTIATITGWSLLLTSFTIELGGSGIYKYHTEKLWKGVDICEGDGGPFHLYAHKGVRYSIFQNDDQIATFSRNRLIIGNGRNFDLRVNSDVNLPLIISMVLCQNTEDGDDETNDTVTYDFGQLGPEDRRFDEAWRPNDERSV